MSEQFKIDEFQKVSKASFDAAVHAYGEANKGLQAISAESHLFQEGIRRRNPCV